MSTEVNLTNPRDIIDGTLDCITSFKDRKNEMAAAAIEFTELYEDYYFLAKRDGSMLKERMKLAVIKGSENDENGI